MTTKKKPRKQRRRTAIFPDRRIPRALPLALLLCLCGFARAQEKRRNEPPKYALIFGTVYGVDERPVYGVPIKIRRADQKRAKYELLSDHRGEFAQRVPPGPADYVVWADIKSKQRNAPRIERPIHVDNEERVDVGLHLRE